MANRSKEVDNNGSFVDGIELGRCEKHGAETGTNGTREIIRNNLRSFRVLDFWNTSRLNDISNKLVMLHVTMKHSSLNGYYNIMVSHYNTN